MPPKMSAAIQEIVDTSYAQANDLKEGITVIWNKLRDTYPLYVWNVIADPSEILSDTNMYVYIKVPHHTVFWRRFFVLGSKC